MTLVDLGQFYDKIKLERLQEHKISWKVLKIFAQKWSNGYVGLHVTFLWQGLVSLWAFTWEEFKELAEDLGAKVNKCS